MNIIIVLFAAAVLFRGTGCTKETGTPPENSLSVTDAVGRTVRVPGDVKRIVCRGPGVLRLIVYLDAAERVAAIESGFEQKTAAGRPYLLAHPELQKLPCVGTASPSPQPNPEALLTVSPDVVFIANVEPRTADNLQQRTGIPVVVLSYGALGTFDNEYIFTSLRVAGAILDKEKRAEEVIGFIQKFQDDLRKRTENIPDTDRPAVYVGGLGYKGTHGITSTECGFPLFELVHARNAADSSGREGHMFVDREKIIAWDPDVIFMDEGGLQHARNDYRKNPDWYNLLRAVRNRRLYGLLPYNYYTTNIGTALADAFYIGKVIYPEQFGDVVPEQKADEIYTFLVGKPVYANMADDWGGFKRVSLNMNGEQ